MTPYDDLAGARAATARLLAHLDALDPAALTAPSLLPGWSVAHVVAHLAGNAWSHVRMLDGCLAGEVRDQYAGGAQERAARIEELAADPVEALADHRRACAALAERWDAMTDEHWARPLRWLDDAEPSPAHEEPASRRREVEVHGVDLGTGLPLSEAFAPLLLDQLAARDDLPPLVLEAPDRVRGEQGQRVRGTVAALALWLAGRSDGAGLTSDAPLPVLPPWR